MADRRDLRIGISRTFRDGSGRGACAGGNQQRNKNNEGDVHGPPVLNRQASACKFRCNEMLGEAAGLRAAATRERATVPG